MEVSMFKTGEQVVMTDADDYNSIFTVVCQPFRMYQLKGPDDLFYGRLDIQIRHATSEEVAAGHRIDTNTGVTVITPKGTSKVKGGLTAFVDMGNDTHINTLSLLINCIRN